MPKDESLLSYKFPDVFLTVLAKEHSGTLLFQWRTTSFECQLIKRSWEVFEILLEAQLASTPESPHFGFKNSREITAALPDHPDPEGVAKFIDYLRFRLASARFPNRRTSDAPVKRFRGDIIEKNGLGYRLSIPRENIRVLRA